MEKCSFMDTNQNKKGNRTGLNIYHNEKNLQFTQLSKIIENRKNNGNRIVMCHGVFDLIHLGHIEHFRKAKENGDILVVTTTSDKFINKGPEAIFFSRN